MLPMHRRRRRDDARPGRDRHAVLLRAAAGHPSAAQPAERARVVVVGGGIAGVTAAVALAERGVAVHLVEREPDLGGRLRGWPTGTGATAATMTRGFHAFFRQYYNLRALLRRVDPSLGMLRPVADYPLLHRNGSTESFTGIPRTPPWNLAGFVLRSKTFKLGDLRRINPAATSLFDVEVPRTYAELDSTDAASFLKDIGFPAAARHLAFEVFSRSFFADPRSLSAAELATMFHIYFLGSSEGLLFDVPRDAYPRTLWGPMRHHLQTLGVEVRTGTAVSRIDRSAAGYHVRSEPGSVWDADAVVLATDTAALRSLVAASPTLGTTGWRRDIAGLRTAPPFLVSRLWLDRPVRPDRATFLGTSGYTLLDNISVLELSEDEARDWRARTGGSVVELHAYALPENFDQEGVVRDIRTEAEHAYPELAGARIRHEDHVLAADCPLFAPGGFAARPTVTTDDPTLVLAGDLVRIDLPVALMERAATTGFTAANALLARWGLPGHDIWTVGNGGRSQLLRRLAHRARTVPGAVSRPAGRR